VRTATTSNNLRLAYIILFQRFTGSAGTAIISRSGAHLFTDSRYYVQATRQLDGNWTLHKVGMPDIQPWNEWLKDRPRGSRIGVDSRLISHGKHVNGNTRLAIQPAFVIIRNRYRTLVSVARQVFQAGLPSCEPCRQGVEGPAR
jgi:hypothetical protein